ncbi:hypothetical protein OEG86_14585 [Hoeflea alexandrii]|nr:hypothetical protein [Hoeflea alexandrii]MCY0153267.1 hypothetical protein [Hoeflea alexandrii]
MADLHKTRHEPIKQLFEILDDTHAVMAKPGKARARDAADGAAG